MALTVVLVFLVFRNFWGGGVLTEKSPLGLAAHKVRESNFSKKNPCRKSKFGRKYHCSKNEFIKKHQYSKRKFRNKHPCRKSKFTIGTSSLRNISAVGGKLRTKCPCRKKKLSK